jgi:hypothetical protein
MGDIPVEFAILAPAIIPVVKAISSAGMPGRFLPLVALLIGLSFSLLVFFTTVTSLVPVVAGGIMAGASAVGLHQAGAKLNSEA